MNEVPPPPLLHYELTTDPDPPQASPASGKKRKLALTFVVSPPDRGAVFCDRITFHFDVGPTGTKNATYLTSVGDAIRTVPPNPPGQPAGDWELDEGISGPGTYSFVRTTDDTKVDGEGYVFTIGDIVVSPVVGTARLKVTEFSSTDGSDSIRHEQIFEVPKFPTTFGADVFETDKTSVEPNTGATLRWKGDDTATYRLFRNGKQVKAPIKFSWPTGALTEDTVFTLRVGYQSQGVNIKRDYYVTILVRNPVVNLMGPKGPVRSGDSFTLKWHTESVQDCFIQGPGLPRKKVTGRSQLDVRPQRAGDAEYRLSATTASGDTIQSEFTIKVLPKAPKADAQLVLVKTSGNKDGKVAILVADGADRFQKGPTDLATGWAEADSSSGTLTIAAYERTSPAPDLVYVKTPHKPGDWVEFHVCRSPQHGQGDDIKHLVNLPWWLVGLHLDQAGAVPSSTWLVASMGDPSWDPPVPAVVAVRTAETDRGNVEVYYSSLYMGFPTMVGPWYTAYPSADASKGTWLLADMDGDGLPPDLVFVQTKGTKSGKVELSYATGKNNYTQLGPTVVTGFNTKPAANGTWHLVDMTGDGKPDLVFVKTAKTTSKRVELYWAEAAKGYKKPVGGFTRFDVAQGPTGTWCVLGVGAPKLAPPPAPDPVRPDPRDRLADQRFGRRGATR